MGKFFVAGVFLGAAVTFTIFHFLRPEGLAGEALEKKIYQECATARAEATRVAKEDAKAQLEKKVAELAKKHGAALEQTEAARAKLAAEKGAAESRVADARRAMATLAEDKRALEKRLAAARSAGQTSDAPKGLLVLRAKLLRTETRLWRDLGEVAATLEQAKIGWADVGALKTKAKALPALAKEYAGLATDVKTFLEENSAALGRELGELAPYRFGIQGNDVKAINTLVSKIAAAAEAMSAATVRVSAKSDRWTDAGVYVKKGDIIQVRAKGIWRMMEHRPPSGPEGWDGDARFKIAENARAGGLILRVSVSQDISPAYLGQPIEADQNGRVVLRMNDKDPAENRGEMTARLVCVSPGALDDATAEWRKLSK